MEKKAELKSIWVYPIKSLDGIEISQTKFNPSGGLVNDRTFSLKDYSGEYINAKNYPEIIKVRSAYNLENGEIILSLKNSKVKFSLVESKNLIEEWFSDFLNKKIQLHENTSIGFPDDRKRPGPTVYSLESLNMVHSWFPDLSIDELRRRFRGNIELENSEQKGFWEDDLLNTDMRPGQFKIGDLEFNAVKPCPRCPVPGRDSTNSKVYSGFQRKYSEFRKSCISDRVNDKLFPHFYMFAINTIVTNSENGIITKGDEVWKH